jgi:hypothetical protein
MKSNTCYRCHRCGDTGFTANGSWSRFIRRYGICPFCRMAEEREQQSQTDRNILIFLLFFFFSAAAFIWAVHLLFF